MTKQHFISLADTLRETRPLAQHQAELAQWQNDVNAIAVFCARQNPLFKRDRWLSYIAGECGPNGGPVKR